MFFDIKNDEDYKLLKGTILEMKDTIDRIEQTSKEQLEVSKRIEELLKEKEVQ